MIEFAKSKFCWISASLIKRDIRPLFSVAKILFSPVQRIQNITVQTSNLCNQLLYFRGQSFPFFHYSTWFVIFTRIYIYNITTPCAIITKKFRARAIRVFSHPQRVIYFRFWVFYPTTRACKLRVKCASEPLAFRAVRTRLIESLHTHTQTGGAGAQAKQLDIARTAALVNVRRVEK